MGSAPETSCSWSKTCTFFDAKFDREWKTDENRTNTLVFIGKNFDRAALTEGFKASLV